MAEVIKFRAARKKLDRLKKEKRADQNRGFFGLRKAQKDAAKANKSRQGEVLDDHLLSNDPADPKASN